MKPIRTQLCVCLAGLALQMLEWRDVLDMIVSALGNDVQSSVVLLEFLTVLPEEVTEGRKVSLSVRSPIYISFMCVRDFPGSILTCHFFIGR